MNLYKKSGVDVEAGEKVANKIASDAAKTFSSNVLKGIGGFASLYELDSNKYENPVIVSSTDGVGTKIKIAQLMNCHDSIGIDLVAMCVNDIITTGAKPLFFLDYIAIGKVEEEKVQSIISGIIEGCKQSNCSLIGGETAEHPGVMPEDDYDLAGFVVGVVDKNRLIEKSKVKAGDSIIGLASSGLHSNGFSLVRKLILEEEKAKISTYNDDLGCTLGEGLLKPTKIYVNTILELTKRFEFHGIAHITGGGITKNVPRVIPENLTVNIDRSSWNIPYVFEFIKDTTGSSEDEMFETFNMGIGMVLIVDANDEKEVIRYAEKLGEKAFKIGVIMWKN